MGGGEAIPHPLTSAYAIGPARYRLTMNFAEMLQYQAHTEYGPSVLGCFLFFGLLMETSTKVGADGERSASHIKATIRLLRQVSAMKRVFSVRFIGFAFGVFKAEMFSGRQRTAVVLYNVLLMCCGEDSLAIVKFDSDEFCDNFGTGFNTFTTVSYLTEV
ncbi:unnamed protein product [Toxocara canis]|uniref:Uncharacterized protein n=1 Tax=Toxocara canis TaxID=6265 RepID=A0A183U0I7_TOXCA|nr:unnamed protein product [Toxocara canis]